MKNEKEILIFDLNRLIRENVRAMTPYSSARDEYVSDGSEKIFMDANENPNENGLNRYPDPQQRSLKSALAGIKGIQQDHILLGNGSDEVLDLLFRAFCEPSKDNVITVPPTYGMYSVLASLNNIENRKVLLTPSFTLDVKGVLNSIDANTKMIFLCSPNNPTGNCIPKDQIKEILDHFHGLVVIDEAYIDFTTKGSWLGELANYKNLVVTQTFSKAYGMAAVRLGSCFASSEIINILNKIKPPYNVNELTQIKAKERLLMKNEVEHEVAIIIEERKKLERALRTIPFVQEVYPSEANFLLTVVDDAGKRYRQLLDRGIIVRNRSGQPLCKNTLRFTVGTPAENESLIKLLKEVI
ncbi:MAG: histidinol-phosphate transaminase [Eudoraea sp.]|nr:histidinol-phosphate transaminase [Eudoraea sp.]